MIRILDCLSLFHDYPMVVLAALICAVGCFSTAVVASRALATQRNGLWAVLIGLSFGATAWSTHFVAMLAYRLKVPITYAGVPTVLSLLVGLAIVIAGCGCALVLRRSLAGRLLGGAAIGSGVLALHYIGMSGLRFSGSLNYSADLVVLSIVFGIGIGMLAANLTFTPGNGRWLCFAGAGLFFLMIVSLHFTGMGAAEITLGLISPGGQEGWPRAALATGVVIVLMMVLAIGVSAALLDRRMMSHLTYLARHDALTDLPNRRYFSELCEQTQAQALNGGPEFSVFVLDFDDFKAINDVHGHAAGDTFIRTVARRLAGLLREGDVLARLGGDEFALIQRSVDVGDEATQRLSGDVHAALAIPVSVGDVQVQASVSVGIARYPVDGESIDQLLRNADVAMYHAKSNGRGMSVFFANSMNAALEARRRIEARLRVALSNGSLSVNYQPLVNSSDGVPVCCEALLRWDDEELGRVDPDVFLPIAESTGLIVPIGDYVIDRACHDATSWPDELPVAVNLSVRQFSGDGLVESVSGALQRSGLPGARLELEITESLFIEDRSRLIGVLNQLRELGVEITMDDFGTGNCSLTYLQSVDIDKIKIDRAFVSNIQDGLRDASIARAAIAMGRSLGMRVVAEGVETDLQASLLAELQCDELQGYLIARPMTAERLQEFLAGDVVWDGSNDDRAKGPLEGDGGNDRLDKAA